MQTSAKMELELQPAASHLMKLDGILDNKTTRPHYAAFKSNVSSKATSSGSTTVSSNSRLGSSSNNISESVDTVTDTVSTMSTTNPMSLYQPTTQSASQRPSDDRSTPVCFVQLVKGVCHKPECGKIFSHDEATLNRTRKELVKQWSTGSTIGASKANLSTKEPKARSLTPFSPHHLDRL